MWRNGRRKAFKRLELLKTVWVQIPSFVTNIKTNINIIRIKMKKVLLNSNFVLLRGSSSIG